MIISCLCLSLLFSCINIMTKRRSLTLQFRFVRLNAVALWHLGFQNEKSIWQEVIGTWFIKMNIVN